MILNDDIKLEKSLGIVKINRSREMVMIACRKRMRFLVVDIFLL